MVGIEFRWISEKFNICVAAYEKTQCGQIYEGRKFYKHFFSYRKLRVRVRVCDIENFHYSFLTIKQHSQPSLMIQIEFKWIPQKFHYIRHSLRKQRSRVYEGRKFYMHFFSYRKLRFRVGIGNIQNFDTSFLMIKQHSQPSLMIRIEFKFIPEKIHYIRQSLRKINLLVPTRHMKFVSTFMHIENWGSGLDIGDIQNFDTSFYSIKHHFQSFGIIKKHFWTLLGFSLYATFIMSFMSSTPTSKGTVWDWYFSLRRHVEPMYILPFPIVWGRQNVLHQGKSEL